MKFHLATTNGNVVSADDMMDEFGADTGRLFELFAAPPEKDLDWTTSGAEGAYRFIGRVFRFVTRSLARRYALDAATVNLVLTDLKPNRPTFQQMADTPGLDGINSVSIGGATIEGEIITADGRHIPVR